MRRNPAFGGANAERLTWHWSDWIDDWAVDLDAGAEPGGDRHDVPFQADWWAFRRRRARALPLQSPVLRFPAGSREVAVLAIDPFGRRTVLRLSLFRH